jgi:arylsulfatase A-like enzyme
MFTGMRSFPYRWNFDRRGHWHHAPGWHKIPPSQDTIAEILLDHGYMTGLVADTYHMFKPTMNYTRGFGSYDFIRGQETDNWRGGNLDLVRDELARCVRDPDDTTRYAGIVQYLLNMRGRKSEDDYLCARVFTRASEWLEENRDNTPFFLWVDSFDPHEPWDPPKEYVAKYSSDYTGLDPLYPQMIPDRTAAEDERAKALYFGEVTFVDRWIGRFLDTVDSLDLWDDTLVIVASDHGTQLLDHGLLGKGCPYLHPHSTRLNLLVRHPQVPGGTGVDGFVQAHDIPATILALLGIDQPMEGLDFWPLVTGETNAIRDHVVIGWAHWADGPAVGYASVRDPQWNYIVSVGKRERDERLFHLAQDPEEQENVIESHPDIAAMQRERVERVIGGSVTAPQLEVSDRSAPAPIHRLFAARRASEGDS